MEVITKSIYEARAASDGTRVLVSRFYPRGVKRNHFDLWIREASPEPDLLKKYKKGSLNWMEFSKRFKEQLKSSPESQAAIDKLVELGRERQVTLLCYERQGEHCHREIVKAAVNIRAKRKRLRRESSNKI
ncbi:MAG: DUF488 family protein [Nitrososphaerota archaeon]|nr:DUF488 family protein [Nitrososphaerota archaeon]